jgi:hypothetical protein
LRAGGSQLIYCSVNTLLSPLLPLALLLGCAPTLTQTALTNGKGRLQVAPELGVAVIGFGEGQSVLPGAGISARYGITDRFDLGLRLGVGLTELQTKILLLEPADRATGLAVALAPTLGLSFADAAGFGPLYARLSVPVLLDIPVSRHRLVLGARVAQVIAPAEAGGLNQGFELSAGLSVGFAFALGSVVQLIPEVGLDAPIAGRATALLGTTAPQLSARLGVLLGGSPQVQRSAP